MKRIVLTCLLLCMCLSCEFTNYDKLIQDEGEAANAGTPGVTITSPTAEEHIITLDKDDSGSIIPKEITLSGYANDGYGNPITDDSAFTWTSDINGQLGKGSELAIDHYLDTNLTLAPGALKPGTHKITLSAEDTWGNTSSQTVTVHVPNVYVEDFTNDNSDPVNTTGVWETGVGAHLGPYIKDDLVVRDYVGKWYTNEIAVSGNYAYVTCGYADAPDSFKGLLVLDIRIPENPAKVGECATPAVAYGVAVSGNYAYIADESSGLVIVDISVPTKPVLTGSLDTAGSAYGVAVSGNYAYIADGSNGLAIVDISNPASPVLTGSRDTAGSARGVAVSSNYAYIADDSNGLVIFDIRNKANPVLTGSRDTAGSARGVAVSGNYAYIADGSNGLVIFDISNKTNPVLTGSRDTAGSACKVAVSGNYAYIADASKCLAIVDISNPASPALINSYATTSFNYTYGVAVKGSCAYITDSINGIAIFNVSTLSNSVLVGSYDKSDSSISVTVRSNYAYIADGGNGLVILDISNPASPKVPDGTGNDRGHFDTVNANYIAVSSNYAYIADWDNGLVILDITDKANPKVPDGTGTDRGHYQTTGLASGVVVSGNYAYISCFIPNYPSSATFNGLEIIDVSDPASPAKVASCATPGEAMGVAVSGSYAYIATETGLVIVNISNPASPAKAGEHSTTDVARKVTVSGNYAYIANNSNGLVIVNISNPASPVLAGSYKTVGAARAVAVSGNYAYIANWDNGLVILDITDKANPKVPDCTDLGHFDTVSIATGVAVDGNYVYTTVSSLGLQIIGTPKPYSELFNDTDEQQVHSKQLGLACNNVRFLYDSNANNQFLQIEMSGDNGRTWQPVADKLLITLGSSSNDLRWRARMSTKNRYVSPIVKKLYIEYWEK